MNRPTENLVDAGKWLASVPGSGLSALFFAMAQLRHAPAVHPRGVTFSAQLTVNGRNPLIALGNYLVTVKLSKGAGTPNRWPDVLGVALRIRSLGAAVPCDFLFSSAGDGRWTRWLPVPAGDWGLASYGTLAPYESAGRWWWLMLRPSGPPVRHASLEHLEHAAPSGFILQIGGEAADWHPIGELSLHKLLAETGQVFDPVLNHPAAARVAPNWLRELRERAYSGSRRGRDAPSSNGSTEAPPYSCSPTRDQTVVEPKET